MKTHAIQPSTWNRTHLNQVLSQFSKKKVLVIGDVGVDRYTIGAVERISPEAPVPIVLVQEEKLKLGLAANVADNIRALGGSPHLIGVIGHDRGGDDFRLLLKNLNIPDAHLVTDTTRRTVLKERVVSERQQLVRIDYESPHLIDEKVSRDVLQKFQELLPQVDGVIVEDYAKGMLTEDVMKKVFQLAQRAQKVIAVDPNLKTGLECYQGASVLTPNTREAEHLSGIKIVDEKSLVRAGAKILEVTASQHVVITRGKDGMAIFTQGSSTVQIIPTYAKEVYDVSGAGDTVISVLLLSLVSGGSIEDASILGNLAAGIEVGKRGTATVSPEEIKDFLDSIRS